MTHNHPMCGRYNLITDANALIDFFEVHRVVLDLASWQPRYNVAPSQNMPVIRHHQAGRELLSLRWGLLPHWAKQEKSPYSMINARAETVSSKPAFHDAFRRRRCLIPATGFFEWQKTPQGKQPFNFRTTDHELFAMAGLWEHWEGPNDRVIESFTIIVTDANERVLPIHDRMPVILDPTEYEPWLDPSYQNLDGLQAMLDPYPAEKMVNYPVSRCVNSPANDEERCVEVLQGGPSDK